jgi:hypothetical protein
MRTTVLMRITGVLAIFWLTSCFEVFAQIKPPAAPPISMTDESGFDIVSRQVQANVADVSIGSGELGLNHVIHSYGGFMYRGFLRDSFYGELSPTGQVIYPDLGGQVFTNCDFQFSFGSFSDCFDSVNGQFISRKENGSSLVYNSDGTHTYVARDGTKISIAGFVPANTPGNIFGGPGVVTKVSYPTGLQLNIHRKTSLIGVQRIQSVTSNVGLQIKYSYFTNVEPVAGNPESSADWTTLSKITAINNRFEYCAPLADNCTLTQAWKSATHNWSSYIDTTGVTPAILAVFGIIDQAGLSTRYTLYGAANGGDIVRIKPPTSSSDIYLFTLCMNIPSRPNPPFTASCRYPSATGNYIDSPNNSGNVAQIYGGVASYTKEGRTYRFVVRAGSDGNPSRTSSSASHMKYDPEGRVSSTSMVNYINPNRGSALTGVSFPDGTSYTYSVDLKNRLLKYSNGQLASFDYEYDTRGNIKSMTRTPPANSSAGAIVTKADYPAACSNIVTCNKPNSVTDGRGNITQYTYDPVHGGIKTVTEPANANGVAAQTRYFYAQLSAQFLNASGTLVTGEPIWMLVQESSCKTGAASGDGCAVAGDEVRKVYQYGPASGPQDLLLHGIIHDATGLALRTCYSYDIYRNRISETTAGAGLTSCP